MALASGEWVEVSLAPGHADPSAFLERAAQLVRQAMGAERRILHDAVTPKINLLDLYDHWREAGERVLTRKELEERLVLMSVGVEADFCVDLGYALDEEFGGHSVHVQVNEHMRVVGAIVDLLA
jgi:hypothetical protein